MQQTGPILVVDDEEDLRNLLELSLRREGFETLHAASATEALELLRQARPSVVVLDLMLPDLPGTEVCRRIRANPDLANVPIIMLTARGEEIDRVVGFEVGADDYVVKASFSVREFLLRVRAVLRRAGGADGPAADGPAPGAASSASAAPPARMRANSASRPERASTTSRVLSDWRLRSFLLPRCSV
ncbi:MAG: response regulator [Planctomycetota bacterium]